MGPFIQSLAPIRNSIIVWVKDIAVLIRTNSFLLFTVGFVALAYAVILLGRILSRE